PDYSRRAGLKGALAGAASAALPSFGAEDLAPVYDEIRKRHDEAVQRIQHWIRQPTIAAENVGSEEGLRLMIELLRDAGFQRVDRIGTDGKPGVFAILDAEGEEEIGSPHFPQVVRRPEVMQALAKCAGITMPSAAQEPDGEVTINLGAKGIIECELVASGEKWGRGPAKDIHSSLRAAVDSPSFHLVKALDALVTPDGVDPAIDGWFERVRALSPAEQKMIDAASQRLSEDTKKKQYGVRRWVRDVPFRSAWMRLAAQPTVNIEGLVGGYTGQGGKTVLPHRAVAKLDFRLVPDMAVDDCLKKLRAHLDK